MKCEHCGTESPEGVAFCKECGASLKETEPAVNLIKPTVNLAKAEPAETEAPAAVENPAPAPLGIPARTATPAPAVRKVSGKAIAGMVLGLIGLEFAILAPIYAIIASVAANEADSVAAGLGAAALIMGLFGLGCGIPGIILANRGAWAGSAPANHGIAKCGRITSLITIILCGIGVFMSVLALAAV